MALWDFQSPDIVYGEARYLWCEWPPPDALDTLVVLQLQNTYRLFALRVHALRDNLSRVMSQTYHVWRCTNEYKGRRCDYFPGHEDMPPLPGQKCYNCGGERAVEIPAVMKVEKA